LPQFHYDYDQRHKNRRDAGRFDNILPIGRFQSTLLIGNVRDSLVAYSGEVEH